MPTEKKKRTIPPPPGLDFVAEPPDTLIEDLRYTMEHAKDFFADIAWEFTSAPVPTVIYAHKAILYARSSRLFQEKYLKNKDSSSSSARSIRLSTVEPLIYPTDANYIDFKHELTFFYTGEEGSQEFMTAVDTTDELEQEKLKEDLLYMLKSKLYTDIELTLSVPDDCLEILSEEDEYVSKNVKPRAMRAHRFMLRARSDYFRAMLESDYADSRAASTSLDASIFNETSLDIILTFIYTGTISSKPLTLETCEMVYIGSDFLGIKSLGDLCVHRIAIKVHFFSCTCTECQSVIPRVATFSREHEVDILWQGCLHVLTHGFDAMWPQKAFADLDEDIREEVFLNLLTNIQSSQIVQVFKGCRKVLAIIDAKGIGLPWIETIRRMISQVRTHITSLLVENFSEICDHDEEFLNCVDGIGFSSDLLEDITTIVVEEGLTEDNAGVILTCITGKLLTRETVSEGDSLESKRVLLQAKQNVFDYVKKRWVGVRQYGGFRGMSSWLLNEFSQELNVPVKDLTDSSYQQSKPMPYFSNGSSSFTSMTKSQSRGLSTSRTVTNPANNGKSSASTSASTNGNGTNGSLKKDDLKETKSNQSENGSKTTTGKSGVGSSNGSTSSSATSSATNARGSTVTKTKTTSASTSTSSSSSTVSSTRKGKSVRIGETTTTSSYDRPTRASVLRQKALKEAAAKDPIKAKNKTNSQRQSTASISSTKSSSSTTSITITHSIDRPKPSSTRSSPQIGKASSSRTPTKKSSTASLTVPKTSPLRGREPLQKSPTSTPSSRASSVASTRSISSPSVSPTRFGGVRQTRSSMLRQMKFDEIEQRRGRGRDRNSTKSPGSSRASSIASVSSVSSSTSHTLRHRSPSQYSTSTTVTTASTSSISSLPPLPYQVKLATTKDPDISVGRRVILPKKNNAKGTIQFLGETEFAKGIWVGIGLDNPVGKNNGTVANVKYFEVAGNHGIFVRPDCLLLIG